MAVKVKICGLKSMYDIETANITQPDYVGFVFAKSKRQISPEHALQMKQALDKNIKAVGVFVDENQEFIRNLVNRGVIDMVQQYRPKDTDYGVPIIQGIRVENATHIIETTAEYVLFDTYSKGAYGGTGETFDWELLQGYKKPFFLAGGLNCGNVAQAVRITKPYCVDVSSGVEEHGIKSREKVIDFVNMVRNAKVG